MTLFRDEFDSPCGLISIVFDGNDILLHLDFPDQGKEREENMIKKRFPRQSFQKKPSPVIQTALLSYLSGDKEALDHLSCNPGGTSFQQEVWQALRAIPYGQTLSYGALAKRLNKPNAVRAVARANALNPISLVIPCHRVIGTNGSLTGYAGGLKRKEWLLQHEGAII